MKVGVVIPAYNLWNSYTKPCLDSLKSKHELRIVLIDNGSVDETKREASKLVSASFAHHRNEDNLGCSVAWNWGINDSFEKGCDYVLVLNNDTLLQQESINLLVDRFEKNEQGIVMVTCMDVTSECSSSEKIFELKSEDKKDVPESDHPNFSAFMINRSYWEKIGEFDDSFSRIGKAYFEDNDSHYRVKLAGLKAITLPTALFYHYGSRTQNQDLNAVTAVYKSKLFELNKAYYVKKWGGVPGSETYTHPFNDTKNSVRWTVQHPQ